MANPSGGPSWKPISGAAVSAVVRAANPHITILDPALRRQHIAQGRNRVAARNALFPEETATPESEGEPQNAAETDAVSDGLVSDILLSLNRLGLETNTFKVSGCYKSPG
jgi:hypothetical protein